MILKPGTTGWKWSDDIKNKIRATCLKIDRTKEWREKRINASNEVCNKKVICIETGKEYKSESAAAKELKVKPIQISRVVRGERHTVHGLSFRFIV